VRWTIADAVAVLAVVVARRDFNGETYFAVLNESVAVPMP
jgi:hypothetical protein